MAFHGAHSFVVNGDINAVDNSRRGESGFNQLVKAACLGAGHQSDERYDPPKCHPETRKSVMTDIMSWADSVNAKEKIMWLNGPAGAGKSAIVQSIAERCHKENKLISSFFFSRTAIGTGRDDGARLIPTITYHLAMSIPNTKNTIIAELERNPAILSYSKKVQMEMLILNPLSHATTSLNATGISHIPHLVIIDGLDECKGPDVQSSIITAIASILAMRPSVHLQFLIASRPELKIRQAFSLQEVEDICAKLTLDESYDPDKDIEMYLQSEFRAIKRKHTLSLELSGDWPSPRDISELVVRSSGQFIYASTVIKYIGNDRRDPRKSLQTIIHQLVLGKYEESPYVQLDALYALILSIASAEAGDYSSICSMFQALLYISPSQKTQQILSPNILAEFTGITQADLKLRFVDLHSIVFIPSEPQNIIRFFHASFSDFLKDHSRSREYFIPAEKAHIAIGQWCLATIWGYRNHALSLGTAGEYASENYFTHLQRSHLDDELLNGLREKNVPEVLEALLLKSDDTKLENMIRTMFKFNLSALGLKSDISFAIPIKKDVADICISIHARVNEELLRLGNYQDKCIRAITAITEARRWYSHPLTSPSSTIPLSTSTIYCWLGILLENCESGKHTYLTQEKCQNLFATHWQEFSHYPSKKHENLSQARQSLIALDYLLGRIKPSIDFGMFLQKELPKIDSFVTDILQSPGDSYQGYAVSLKKRTDAFLQECSTLADSHTDNQRDRESDTDHKNEAEVEVENTANHVEAEYEDVGTTRPVRLTFWKRVLFACCNL